MSIDSLKSLLSDFDPASLIPSVDSLMGHLPGLMRYALQAGPWILLVFGLIYLFFAPKEANYSLGFRSYWGMASVEAWQFTQFVAGCVWVVLGLVLLIWVKARLSAMAEMDVPTLLDVAIRTIITQICWAIASIVVVNAAVIAFFDFGGSRRSFAEGWTLVPDLRGMVLKLWSKGKKLCRELFDRAKSKAKTK